MSGNHNSTRNNNIDVLVNDLKLTQLKNSTIFENNDYFVLSPSVQNKKNWFDLRKVNLDKFLKEKKGILLIRLLNDFILIDLRKFTRELIDDNPYITENSGIHWKFQITESLDKKKYIFNTKSKKRFYIEVISKDKLKESINYC
ncbi:hypothetical protein [Lutibacter sp. B1]|uniref:hypothetical protein n=1 Tax=Lutibacter sp. B1 TaxID=2725996 RepID=UPI0014570E63|nr:hypothetical protein [Lutibacter sp. B1]NLP59467.1 hypothetical protein [Lutibacter sp. B1]